MSELGALPDIIKSGQLIIISFFITKLVSTLGFFIFCDCLSKQFEALVSVALILALVQVDP
jgi:hypothetical protein